MKRIIAIALLGGLLGGLAYAPATAAKKKPKKPKAKIVAKDVSYYLRRNGCGTAEDVTSLSVENGTDEGTGCGSRLGGAPNVILGPAGQPQGQYVWAATDGVPFTLNATKDITGSITLRSSRVQSPNENPMGAGEATLQVTLTGTSGDEVVTLGSGENTYSLAPGDGPVTSEFTFTPDAALNKAAFTSLELTTVVTGPVVFHGYYELEDPASHFTIPTLVKKK